MGGCGHWFDCFEIMILQNSSVGQEKNERPYILANYHGFSSEDRDLSLPYFRD